MDEKMLKRIVSICFLDDLSLLTRFRLINSDIPVSEVLKCSGQRINTEEIYGKVSKWLDSSDENRLWMYGSENYPSFEPIDKHLPYLMFVRGVLPDMSKVRIGIVGTRHCDYEGLQKSFSLGLEASVNGMDVVTGLAEGCDQASACGCISADGGGTCTAVLGCGLDVNYPNMSKYLKDQIVSNGGNIISRFIPGTLPFKYNFPNRNVIIAALSTMVIVVQAPEGSGSLQTSDFALQMGKDVCISSAGNGSSVCRRGTESLKEEGAFVVSGISDWTECIYKAVKSEKGIRFGSAFYSLKRCNGL